MHNITLLAIYSKACKIRAETNKKRFYEKYRDCRKSTGEDASEAHGMGHWDSIIEIMLSIL